MSRKSYVALINVTGRARVFVDDASSPEAAQQRILDGDWDDAELIEWEGDTDRSSPPKVEEQ